MGCQCNIYNAKGTRRPVFSPFCPQITQSRWAVCPNRPAIQPIQKRTHALLVGSAQCTATQWRCTVEASLRSYFSKLGGRPTIHKKHGKQAVWLTSELFKFVPVVDTSTGEITDYQLHVGIKKFPVGLLTVKAHKAHKAFNLPASLHISIHAGRWHVSFNYDDGIPEPTDKDTTDWLTQFDEVALRKMTVGLDRDVTLPLAGSDYQKFDFTQPQKQQLLKQERHKKRWQRRQARRDKGSVGWVKAKHRVARYQRYGADVLRDVAHKASHTLASDPRYKLFVFEALKVKNMTAKAKPKQDEQGRWIKNDAATKSGLNKSILASTWGQTNTYLQYKARRQGQLVIEVSPCYASQECAACGHVHQDNRVSQAEFVCLSCGNTDHADHNAAKGIAMCGVRQLLAGKCIQKEKKRCRITRIKVGRKAPNWLRQRNLR